HRGMKVCRADEGNAASFTCAYHGWTYGNDGKLIGVPNFQDAYFEQLDMEQWGLVPVAQVDSYKGLWFGNFDAGAPSLIEYLGNMAYYLDIMLDRREGGVEILHGSHKWVMPCNWKFAADNFQGDNYHVTTSHLSALILTGVSGGRDEGTPDSENYPVYAGNGHGIPVVTLISPEHDPSIATIPPLQEYYAQTQAETESRIGKTRAAVSILPGTVFPNFSVLFLRNFITIRVWHPRGAGKVEAWSWTMVDRDAPPHVKQILRQITGGTFSPSGIFEQDDGENWNQCTESSRGPMARKHSLNFQMGMGYERTHEELPGSLGSVAPSEVAQRGFYRRWSQMINAKSWDEITPL
ncbi:MAG TPA: aromatic ring-hydroxylating dioxygenase subunit alpha, partial [Dehalococcoidia bacterium]|nr:aromatic ring-hydroxylating dioxygenase subunit alpha [Dehalococcoidia bacterium]